MPKVPFTVREITQYLEKIAPIHYQASYDNSGLQVGNPNAAVEGILIALDVTQAVLEEAVEKGCNLLITHHPLLFNPIKKVTSEGSLTRAIIYAIEHKVNLYAIHTNLDHLADGINQLLGKDLGLTDLHPLSPLPHTHDLLTTFVPPESLDRVKKSLFQAGAGDFAPYRGCSFTSTGEATSEANSHIGQEGKKKNVEELCLRTMVPAHCQTKVISALLQNHPYEKPLYYIQPLPSQKSLFGIGLIGTLPNPISPLLFIRHVKEKLALPQIRYTQSPQKKIQRVALCSGSGSTFLPDAIRAKADAFITADVKYHQFFETENKLMLLDIGHYESEINFKILIYKLLSKKFDNIALQKCMTCTNPIQYK